MSFLQNFMLWNSGTEVPRNYFFWSGVSAIASCVNGQIYIRQGKFVHYPNMYICLLGPAGNGKTSAIDRAEEIVRAIDETLSVSGQSETAEGLVRHMRDKCIRTMTVNGETIPFTPISLFLSELSNFFGKDPAGMIDFITGIWDRGGRQFHRRTKGQGEDMIPRPNVNLLSGTTPAWLTQYLKADIVGGGFTRRVVFDNEPRRDPNNRVSWPEDTPEQLTAKNNCIAYGRVLRNLYGEVKYTPEAKLEYTRWYDTRPPAKGEEDEGYHASKPTLMLKTAMLLAVSREPKLEVTRDDILHALALLDESERHRQKVFTAIGRNELNAIAQKVLGYLEGSPEGRLEYQGKLHVGKFMNKKVLLGFMYRDGQGRECEDIIRHLTQTEKVREVVHTEGNTSRTFVVLLDGFRPQENGQHPPA